MPNFKAIGLSVTEIQQAEHPLSWNAFYDPIRSQILILAIVSRDPFFGPVDNGLDNLHI